MSGVRFASISDLHQEESGSPESGFRWIFVLIGNLIFPSNTNERNTYHDPARVTVSYLGLTQLLPQQLVSMTIQSERRC
ncbi:hypothetical protein K7432_003573 [Basidiobolus ranarum]|uniref:Uncharacterized protein n=1 Tax=Basidiobolus ranarum TaxID=34480 RepID=A0ABR2W6H0_9FUNG